MATAIHSPSGARASDSRWPTAMVSGLVLTVIATLAPVVDMFTVDTISDHVRESYPDWGSALVDADRNAMVIYLVITGVLGILCWLFVIRAIIAGKRWARLAAAISLVAGTVGALVNLTLPGGEYDVILPIGYGTLTLLPCLAGLAAVFSLWRPGYGKRRA